MPRISAGLAIAGSPGAWEELRGERDSPRLRDVWRVGRGLGMETLGLWLHLAFVLVVQFVVLVLAPLSILEHFGLTSAQAAMDGHFGGAVLLGPFVVGV